MFAIPSPEGSVCFWRLSSITIGRTLRWAVKPRGWGRKFRWRVFHWKWRTYNMTKINEKNGIWKIYQLNPTDLFFFEGWRAPFYGSNLPKAWVISGSRYIHVYMYIYIYIHSIHVFVDQAEVIQSLEITPHCLGDQKYKYMATFKDFQLVVLMITPDSARLTAETMGMTSSC